MINTYGSKSLYAGRLATNLLTLFNSTLFYSLYFGINSTLSEHYSSIPYKYLINPFVAALTATIPTFIIGHISNTYSSIEMRRYIIARESGRRLMPPAKQSVLL